MTRSLLLLAVVLLAALAGLAGCRTASSSTSGVLPGPQANLPVDSEVPTAAGFNPPAYVDAATVAAANLETERLKVAAVDYLSAHAGTVTVSSDDLGISGLAPAKAWYRFNGAGSVTRVDAVPNGWTGIVFSLSRQKWATGSPDDDHPADQDIP